jgi:hypothetical protein
MKPLIKDTTMNKTEQLYAQKLELRKRAGEILDYKFEAVKLKLADKTYYTPDFLVVFPDHFEFHEVKGFWRDDARVKIKVANQLFPFVKFKAIQLKNKKWQIEEF